MDRQDLRLKMRQQRHNLSAKEQTTAAKNIYKQVITDFRFIKARHIAFYISNDGEIDPSMLLEYALAMGKNCYLPVLDPLRKRYLRFIKIDSNTPMTLNSYGIAEPDYQLNKEIKPWALQLVLTPLLAFDRQGSRLGMGGGFFDQTFSFKRQTNSNKPLLLGLAYGFQEAECLETKHWDVPLSDVICG